MEGPINIHHTDSLRIWAEPCSVIKFAILFGSHLRPRYNLSLCKQHIKYEEACCKRPGRFVTGIFPCSLILEGVYPVCIVLCLSLKAFSLEPVILDLLFTLASGTLCEASGSLRQTPCPSKLQ